MSFSAAARKMGLSTSHVSRAIARVEGRLGARLFNRTTRRIVLTDVGRTLLERVAPHLEQLDEAEALVTDRGDEPRGRIRVTVPVQFGTRYVAPLVARFAARYPGEVAGLVLVDASPAGWPEVVCSVPAYAGGCAVMHDPALDPERLDVLPAFEAVAAIRSLGELPMAVVTAAHRTDPSLDAAELARLDAEWSEGVERWAALSSSSTVVTVDDTGHDIHVEHPELVAGEITRLLP